MINHVELAGQLRPNTISDALNQYNQEVKINCSDLENTKEYLISLNNFIYTYFLLEYNKDLDDLANRNFESIKSLDSKLELINFGKEILNSYSANFSSSLHDNEHELIEKALKYINANFQKKITLLSVANKLHISKNYLCHLFKSKTGYKFCEYINLQRINLAKKLILQDKKNFEFIAFECGFSSQSHFSTTFKKYVGLTPKEYKRN